MDVGPDNDSSITDRGHQDRLWGGTIEPTRPPDFLMSVSSMVGPPPPLQVLTPTTTLSWYKSGHGNSHYGRDRSARSTRLETGGPTLSLRRLWAPTTWVPEYRVFESVVRVPESNRTHNLETRLGQSHTVGPVTRRRETKRLPETRIRH